MSSLSSILTDYKRIAIVGICKNAGKTTVLNYLVDSFHSNCRLGITSIGYDGEDKDAVTGLKKPKVFVQKGMIVATANECIERAQANYKVLEDTKIRTVLGNVLLVSITGSGYIEISGPSIGSQMKDVCDMMEQYGCEKILIDGAAGRKTHAATSSADCMVLSVGAALSGSMDKVVRETKFLVEILGLEKLTESLDLCNMKDAGTFKECFDEKENTVYCVFNGAVADVDLKRIIKKYRKTKKVVVADNPTKLFISERQYHKLLSHNGLIKVKTGIKVAAVTINPMSPYDKWFDEEEFLSSMQAALHLPVFNVMI